MPRSALPWSCVAVAALAGSTSGYATEYLSVEQGQEAVFPGASFTPAPVRLTEEQRKAVAQKSGVRVRSAELHAWRVERRGAPSGASAWFLVDEVLGKHEFITYAVGIDERGALAGIEILTYRETYGAEIRGEKWRRQFSGKTAADPLKLEADIKNISGATLSSRHVTDGVKRLLATHALVLSSLR